MKILTLQSEDLSIEKRTFADPERCSHRDALPVYRRLFDDYNCRFNTDYPSFFWGFSELLTDDLSTAVKRACEMTGQCERKGQVLILDVPDALCLETDYYNFSDEIFAFQYPKELESCWKSIYEKRHSEKQVIFPYIDPEMITARFDLPPEDD